MSSTLNNWKPEWYDVMLSAAYSLVRYGFDVDELINHAWLDSIRRMDLDSSMSYIYRIATRSMNQYIVGGHKRRTRNIAELEFKLRIRTIDGFDFVRNDYCYSYDDVDEILVVLRKLPIRTQEIIVLKLQGMYFKDIGKKYCICEARAHQIFYEGLHGVRNETD